MFQLELKDPAEVKTSISENLMCRQTGIIFKVEDSRAPILVQQCYNCQNFRTLGQKLSGQNEMCHLWRRMPKKEKKQPKCAYCRGPHVASYKEKLNPLSIN